MGLADLLDTLSGATGTAAEGYANSQATLGVVIREGVNEGLSGRATLKAYRAAGGSIANSTFWQVRQSVLASANSFNSTADILAGDLSSVRQIGGGKAGSYRVQLRMHYQTINPDGTIERGYQQFTIHQRELDVVQALADAKNIWQQNPDTESFPGQLIDMEPTGIYQYTGQ